MLNRLPLQKKIITAMLLISIVPILLLAYFTLNISQTGMRDQLVQNRLLGIQWMGDQLSAELNRYADLFYQIEVDSEIKRGLTSWGIGNPIGSNIVTEIRAVFNEVLSTNPHIQAIEIYHPATAQGYLATRIGFKDSQWSQMAAVLGQRAEELQTNIVVEQTDGGLIVWHQVREFTTGKTVAVMVVRLSKYAFYQVMDDSMQDDEAVILTNDAGRVLMELGPVGAAARAHLDAGDSRDHDNFYFNQSINKGKLNLLYIVPNRLIRDQMAGTVTVAVIILLFSLITVILLALLFSEIISKPIITLSRRMQRTDIHNFSAQTPIKRTDEIGMLQESFENMMKRNQELVVRDYQSELEKKEARLRALQAQINPHFIYNTLQVIGGMSLTGKNSDIYPVVTAFGDILHYAMGFDREMVPLLKEVTYLQSYLSIQNSRFNDRIRFITKIDEAAAQALIPKLILQPLVENCIEHGLLPKRGPWEITLRAFRQPGARSHEEPGPEPFQESAATLSMPPEKEADAERRSGPAGDLIISVTDNGLGMGPEQLAAVRQALSSAGRSSLNSAAHIGLNNVHSRLQLQSGADYGLSIQSTPGAGTTITVKVRYRQEVPGQLPAGERDKAES